MPRQVKPEKAALTIIKMVGDGEAVDMNDAVRQKPELHPGLAFLEHAVCEAKTEAPTSQSAPAASRAPARKPATASHGSGPALLSRR